MSTASPAVAVLAWAPLTATTPLATIIVDTDYPFGDTATVTVTPSGSAAVSVLLRIPSWAARGSVTVDGVQTPLVGVNGTFFATTTRAGGAASTFVVDFAPEIRLENNYNGAVAVLRGALVYSVW